MCPERSNAVRLESANLANVQTCSVAFLVVDQIPLRDRLKGAPFALKKVAFVRIFNVNFRLLIVFCNIFTPLAFHWVGLEFGSVLFLFYITFIFS